MGFYFLLVRFLPGVFDLNRKVVHMAKKRSIPSVPVLAKGKAKKRKQLKKTKPGLGPGPHHGSTYKGK